MRNSGRGWFFVLLFKGFLFCASAFFPLPSKVVGKKCNIEVSLFSLVAY